MNAVGAAGVRVAMSATVTLPTAAQGPLRFEGVLGGPVDVIDNLNANAHAFLPYNPTIVEIGAHEGAGTMVLAQTYPYGSIYAFEPNPRAFAMLERRAADHPHVVAVNLALGTTTNEVALYLGAEAGRNASLLSPRRVPGGGEAPAVRVACTTVDEWCLRSGVVGIDFLRVDAGGYELQILASARRMLERALVVVTRTHRHRPRAGIVTFPVMRLFLEMSGFELLSHSYEEGREGEAVFVRQALYDSVFR
jgi:FkbM family methyltransferase